MPSKKKSEPEPKILSVIPAPDWVAVVDEDQGLDVAAWAVTSEGVFGLVSRHGTDVLVLVPEDCVGYVRRKQGNNWIEPTDDAAQRFAKENEPEPEEEDEEDDDSDE